METTINYKGYTIKILQDIDPQNPFENWDCEPSLMVESSNYKHDYSDGEIDSYLQGYLTNNQILCHQKKIIKLFNIDNYEKELKGISCDHKLEILYDDLDSFISENIKNKEKFCVGFNIDHYKGTSRGYSQSDWADVFVIITDKDRKRMGTDPKHDTEVLKGSFKLYGDWAWGNVYGYQIIDKGGEDLDSCWGFYGDPEESGIINEAKSVIDYYVSEHMKKKVQQVKAYIKNHVPLDKRIFV